MLRFNAHATRHFRAVWLSPLLITSFYLVIPKLILPRTLVPQVSLAFFNLAWVPAIADASSLMPLTQQGSQIVLNGKPVNANWSIRQGHIGISDASLTQLAGVSLLSSNNLEQQPVQWFSDPTVGSLTLSTWLTNQFRYLDITSLAQQFGWQTEVRGNSLWITTPAASITGIRQGKQSWGDRLALDLDRGAPWQMSEGNGEFTVTIDAQANPALVQSFLPLPGNLLTSLSIETSGYKTIVRAKVPSGVRPTLSTLTNPNRLIVDVRSDWAATRTIAWAPGVEWSQRVVPIASGQFPVVILSVNPQQSGLVLQPMRVNPLSSVGIAPLIGAAQQWQAIAAINAGFFNRNNQLPLGAVRQNHQWLSGPILNRGAIAWNTTGEITVGRLSLQEEITTSSGHRFPISLLNSGYVRAGLARYTPDWGSTYTNVIDNEVLMTVSNNQIVSHQASGLAGQTTIAIPTDGYTLVARSYNTAVAALPIGTTLQLSSSVTPADFNRYPNVVGGGPLLIQNYQVVLNPQAEQFSQAFIGQSAPRSVIAKTGEGNLMLVTIQNRLGGLGPTLQETAQIMQQLRVVHALNLDGGSSSTLYLGGQLLNRAPQTAARIHNGIGVFVQPNF